MKLLEKFQKWLMRLPLIEHLGMQLLIGLIISLICLAAFAAIAEDVVEQDNIVHFDLLVANALHAEATPASTQIFRTISWIGLPGLWYLCIPVAIYFVLRREWLHLGVLVVAMIGGDLLMKGLKLLFARPRPVFVSPIVVEQLFSFPSGHAMMALIGYGLLAFHVRRSLKNPLLRVLVSAGTILLIIAIGLSRLALGVHYFSDVVAGYAVGGVWLTACMTMLNTIYYRQNRRNRRAGAAMPQGQPTTA